jgi:hypothetical protein
MFLGGSWSFCRWIMSVVVFYVLKGAWGYGTKRGTAAGTGQRGIDVS